MSKILTSAPRPEYIKPFHFPNTDQLLDWEGWPLPDDEFGGIKKKQIQKEDLKAREKLLSELHWWNWEKDQFAIFNEVESLTKPAKCAFFEAMFQIGFHYEAEARAHSKDPSEILWRQGKPFGQLDWNTIRGISRRYPSKGLLLTTNDEKGDSWSRRVRVNINMTKEAATEAIWQLIQHERKERDINPGKTSLPWKGLEEFDRKFANLPTQSTNQWQDISRMFEIHQKITNHIAD